nr:glycosyltransferase family 1 protein [Candidatus Rhodoblastus alkanivorans]
MPKRKIVTPTAAQDPFQGLSRLHVATLFMDATRYHFKLYGRSAKLRVKARPDIFHATQAIPLRVEGARNIYTIHDVVPLKLPQSTLDDKKFFLNMVRHLGATADRIVTVSEASRRDLIDICGIDPNRVVNTYQSVSFPEELLAQTYAESANLVRRAFGLEADDYYLFFGALEPKKNVGRLLDSYIVSGTKRKLALAGGLGWEYHDDLAKIEDLRSHALKIDGARITPDEQIRRLSHVPLFQLTALIRCARAVVFPSLYEGFGLPVLEAMLLGAPVLTSNGSSLPEVAGDAALLVDPTDVRGIAGALRRLDEDDALCADLRQRGYAQAAKFSPEAHKERLARVYDEALAGPPRQNARAA